MFLGTPAHHRGSAKTMHSREQSNWQIHSQYSLETFPKILPASYQCVYLCGNLIAFLSVGCVEIYDAVGDSNCICVLGTDSVQWGFKLL